MEIIEVIINSGILEILKSLGIIIASGVAIWGINSWRREAKWKRKYELAEDVLANLYEAHQAIRVIRSPISFGHEGSSREKNENETCEQTKIYNQAYITRERFEKNKRPFERLHTLKFRFIALYGKDYEEYFDKFSQVVNKIFFASDQVAMIKLGQLGNDPKLNSKILIDSNKYLYAISKKGEEDVVENELKSAIEKIEDKCQAIIGKNN